MGYEAPTSRLQGGPQGGEIGNPDLDKTRIRFFDEKGTWRPGRSLLSLSRSEPAITRLPPTERIIDFETKTPNVERTLRRAISVPGPSPWLLRVQADGVARQVMGHHVRVGQTYVLASTQPLARTAVEELRLGVIHEAEGSNLYELKYTRRTQRHPLGRVGGGSALGYSLGARIDPAGIVPSLDPSTGQSVWSPDDEIILRLSADYAGTGISGGRRLLAGVRIPGDGRPEILCSFGRLPLGRERSRLTPCQWTKDWRNGSSPRYSARSCGRLGPGRRHLPNAAG